MPLAICATPIGNLDDVTLRVLDELRAADLVLCEDTRRTRRLLDRHGIKAKLLSYHEHNEAKRVAEVLPQLAAGERIALVSDAGMPVVSDPGARLVAAARDADVEVTVLPGPSAVETAFAASGIVGDGYEFVAFLPRSRGALAEVFTRARERALVAFESPQRLPATLRALAAVDAMRDVAVCRELTKLHEEVVRGTADTVAARFAEPPKGEITLVIGPSRGVAQEPEDLAAADRAMSALVAEGVGRRRAAEIVADLTGLARNELYRRTL
jgi:16S rRNA (cytidine1402-2'-O)-methyltransferase